MSADRCRQWSHAAGKLATAALPAGCSTFALLDRVHYPLPLACTRPPAPGATTSAPTTHSWASLRCGPRARQRFPGPHALRSYTRRRWARGPWRAHGHTTSLLHSPQACVVLLTLTPAGRPAGRLRRLAAATWHVARAVTCCCAPGVPAHATSPRRRATPACPLWR